MPRVSILLQTYNQGPYLPVSIDSLLSQTCQDFELLIVDDCSPDNTPEILEPYGAHSKVGVIRNESNLGQHASTNLHMQKLSGEFILFASGDDIYYPSFLESVLTASTTHPTAGFIHVNGHIIDSQGRKQSLISEYTAYSRDIQRQLSRDYFAPGYDFFEWLLAGNMIISHSSCVVRRRHIEEAGAFDESLPHLADWDMWLRLALQGDIAYLSQPLFGWRRHESTASVQLQKTGESYEDMIRLAKKLLEKYPSSARKALKDEPYILLLGFIGVALRAFQEQRIEVVRNYIATTAPFLQGYRLPQQSLTIKLAIQAWYVFLGAQPNHEKALAYIQYACQNLPTVLEKRLKYRNVVAHYWALDGYKAWRARDYSRAGNSMLHSLVSSPTYVVDFGTQFFHIR